jgi:hypothetical protein
VTANDPHDQTSIEQVRRHLQHVAKMFAAGDSSIPKAVHAELPSGAARMKSMASELHYEYKTVDGGAQVRISSEDTKAVAAVHEFLRYQIREHGTGDQLEVGQP